MNKLLQQLIPKLIGFRINAKSILNPSKAAQEAFRIFSTPRGGRIKDFMIPYLDTAVQKVLDKDNLAIQSYHWKGTGKKILLIHGWESNTHRWHLLIPELQREHFDIYAIDAPAQGNSKGTILNVPGYAKAIELAYQTFKPDIIIGHSIGGLATLFHQHTYPLSLFEAIVILGSASELSEIMEDYQKILGLNKKTMRRLELLAKERFGYNFKEFSGAAFAQSLTSPALIIHDKYDKITPVSASQNIHKNWKGSEYVETEGFGHSLYQEEVRSRIITFLKKIKA